MPDLHTTFWHIVRDPGLTVVIRRTLDAGVVLDTWMSGQEEERLGEDALGHLVAEEQRVTERALATGAMFPSNPMPTGYVGAAYHELLFSTALYQAQRTKGVRHVDVGNVRDAARRVWALADRPQGLTDLGRFFLTVSSHEDLNAIDYYGRMRVDDFLQGRLHRPWSNAVISAQLDLYRRLHLVDQIYTGTGDRVRLTPEGREALVQIHAQLDAAGELAWRAENQRWVIFGETNYDAVFSQVLPDGDALTAVYLDTLNLRPGMRVLEVGCGTGRATVDLGLHQRVTPGGSVAALDPNRVLLNRLADKCQARAITNVEIVQGRGEDLPFPNHHFDAAIAVASLHFTDWAQTVAEMTRVTKPGGLVSAITAPPELDVRKIPMVALWFRPLQDLASRFGIAFVEHNGLPVGALRATFARNLTEVSVRGIPGTLDASDYRAFMAFVVRGAALFQGVLSRLPYQERWDLIARLEATGADLVQHTSPDEQRAVYENEAAYGRVPADPSGPPRW